MTATTFISYRPEDLSHGYCRECGTEGDLYEGFCASPGNCCHDWEARIWRHVKRANLAGVESVVFDPRDIFIACEWRCYVCGVDTPQTLRGTRDPNAPELDHVVPLSRGGSHTPDNTECSCRQCNWKKGTKLIEEMGVAVHRLSPEKVAAVPLIDVPEPVLRKVEPLDPEQLKLNASMFLEALKPFTGGEYRNHPVYRLYTMKQGFLDGVRDAYEKWRWISSYAHRAEVAVDTKVAHLAAHLSADVAGRIATVVRKQSAVGKVGVEELSEFLEVVTDLISLSQGFMDIAGESEFDHEAWVEGRYFSTVSSALAIWGGRRRRSGVTG